MRGVFHRGGRRNDRYLCGKTTSDIYRIHDPHPGP
jgi:hypothetical protein